MLSLLMAAALASSAAVRVDQAGYISDRPKLVVIASVVKAETFAVVREADGAVVHEGSIPARPVLDKDSRDWVRTADFSAVTTPGRYTLRVADARSAPFDIGADPYRDVLRLAARSYYGQRCGTAVDLGGGYSHPACHLSGAFHRSSGKSGVRTAGGGWHDAGDYGRYVVNSGISTGTLLWTWELFGGAFTDVSLDIPESGNNVPDVLDEIRWNLEWMLTMQDADGGVWHKQTSEDFPGFIAPQSDPLQSYVIGTGATPYKSSCATADFSAVMAIAARVYRPYDEAFATRSLTAARSAYQWTAAHPSVVFRNPAGVATGEYGDGDCSDERLWAAAELWRTADDADAHAYLVAHGDELLGAISSTEPPGWQDVGAMAAWTYLLDGRGNAALVSSIRQRTVEAADAIVARAALHAYRTPMRTPDYVWGSNAVAANYGLHLLIANRVSPSRVYVDATLDIVHYLLGRNPFSLSWVTGVGANAVQRPHHRPSAADGMDAPWPGLLAGGPNRSRQDPVLRRMPAGTPPARMYADDQDSYASNEIAINWNAPLVFVLAGVRANTR